MFDEIVHDGSREGFERTTHVPVRTIGSDDGGTDGNNGTVRHGDALPCSVGIGAAGVPAQGASPAVGGCVPPCHGIVPQQFPGASGISVHNRHHGITADYATALTARKSAIGHHDLGRVPPVTNSNGENAHASPPPAGDVPGGAERPSGRTSDNYQYSQHIAPLSGCAGATAVAFGPVGTTPGAGQRPALNSVSIDLALAAEGARLAAAIVARRGALR